ncbi:hypothetical protein Bbelb_051040 [Branchiostoma belcheri]|nr:hypothetical protein Bbelb_051040 [Branchiostoma belcheri]
MTESEFEEDAWEENIMEDGENHQELVTVDTEGNSVPTANYLQEMEDIVAKFEIIPNEERLGKLEFVLESSEFDIPGAALFARTHRAGVGTSVRNQEETVETDKNPMVPGRTHGSRATGRRSN